MIKFTYLPNSCYDSLDMELFLQVDDIRKTSWMILRKGKAILDENMRRKREKGMENKEYIYIYIFIYIDLGHKHSESICLQCLLVWETEKYMLQIRKNGKDNRE